MDNSHRSLSQAQHEIIFDVLKNTSNGANFNIDKSTLYDMIALSMADEGYLREDDYSNHPFITKLLNEQENFTFYDYYDVYFYAKDDFPELPQPTIKLNITSDEFERAVEQLTNDSLSQEEEDELWNKVQHLDDELHEVVIAQKMRGITQERESNQIKVKQSDIDWFRKRKQADISPDAPPPSSSDNASAAPPESSGEPVSMDTTPATGQSGYGHSDPKRNNSIHNPGETDHVTGLSRTPKQHPPACNDQQPIHPGEHSEAISTSLPNRGTGDSSTTSPQPDTTGERKGSSARQGSSEKAAKGKHNVVDIEDARRQHSEANKDSLKPGTSKPSAQSPDEKHNKAGQEAKTPRQFNHQSETGDRQRFRGSDKELNKREAKEQMLNNMASSGQPPVRPVNATLAAIGSLMSASAAALNDRVSYSAEQRRQRFHEAIRNNEMAEASRTMTQNDRILTNMERIVAKDNPTKIDRDRLYRHTNKLNANISSLSKKIANKRIGENDVDTILDHLAEVNNRISPFKGVNVVKSTREILKGIESLMKAMKRILNTAQDKVHEERKDFTF